MVTSLGTEETDLKEMKSKVVRPKSGNGILRVKKQELSKLESKDSMVDYMSLRVAT